MCRGCENRNYAITAQSSVVEGLQGVTVMARLQSQRAAFEEKWRADGLTGYRIEDAGAVK